jgi:hypothetical protein
MPGVESEQQVIYRLDEHATRRAIYSYLSINVKERLEPSVLEL